VQRIRLAELATKVPPFNRVEARIAFVRRRSELGRLRRRLAERFGSAKYSRPALYDMDHKLERHLPFDGGFFVEAGANDGFLQSNTYYLERFKGWTGILIEPIPDLYRRCLVERRNARVFNYALVSDDYAKSSVKMLYGGLMSVVEGAQGSGEADRAHVEAGSMLGWDRNYELDVPARTLTSVLKETGAPEIDLLSLDVEGYETDVLAGLDFDRWAPRYLLVEMLEPERTRSGIEELVNERYEHVEQLSPHDHLYRRR
jgi:FkbM family methyltransferase